MLYITLRQLEYVVGVAKAGSLTRAASQMNVSQPALSVAITRVEDLQKQKIFIRKKGTPITLTAFGRVFIDHAEALLENARRLEDPANLATLQMQRISIGCSHDLAPSYLAPMLKHIRERFPNLELIPHMMGFEELATSIRDGVVDFALSYDLGFDASFEREIFKEITPHAFVSRDSTMARLKEVTLQELADTPLILSNQELSIHHMLNLFRRYDLMPRIVHRASSVEVMRSLAANGEGVGISYTLPPNDFSYDGKKLCSIKITNKDAIEPIILVRNGSSPPLSPLVDVMQTVLSLGRD